MNRRYDILNIMDVFRMAPQPAILSHAQSLLITFREIKAHVLQTYPDWNLPNQLSVNAQPCHMPHRGSVHGLYPTINMKAAITAPVKWNYKDKTNSKTKKHEPAQRSHLKQQGSTRNQL